MSEEVLDFENMSDEDYEKYRSEMMNENPEVVTQSAVDVATGDTVSPYTSGSELIDIPIPEEPKVEENPNKDVTVDEVPQAREVPTEPVVEEKVDSTPKEEVSEVEKVKVPNTIKIKSLDGSDLEVTSEQVQYLLNEHNKVSKEVQELRPYSKTIDAITSKGITERDIALLIEAKGGNKDALGTLIKQSNIDLLDLSDETLSKNYIPKDYGQAYNEKRFHNEISRAYDMAGASKGRLQEVLTKELDDSFVEYLSKTPNSVIALQKAVSDGRFDIIKSRADTLKMLNPNKTGFELYQEAEASLINEAKRIESANTIPQTPQSQQQTTPVPTPQVDLELEAIRARNAELRAQLGLTSTPNPTVVNNQPVMSQADYAKRQQEEALKARRIQAGVSAQTADINNQNIDIMSMSDEEFEKMKSKLMYQ
jgi:hypothetical protein